MTSFMEFMKSVYRPKSVLSVVAKFSWYQCSATVDPEGLFTCTSPHYQQLETFADLATYLDDQCQHFLHCCLSRKLALLLLLLLGISSIIVTDNVNLHTLVSFIAFFAVLTSHSHLYPVMNLLYE